MVCGKKRNRSKGDTCWWTEEVKDVISKRKDAHMTMCRNITKGSIETFIKV